ncbi:MAG TPA: hypothetical protein PLV68_01520 [Ilumatobacteraceae bacterium]|nr:hypothetical protein [Ilumatobacteraceae bacterium]
MKVAPTIKRRTVTAKEILGDVAAWKAAHPGFDESNFPDAFRDANGELIESDEFFAAAQLFATFRMLH